MNTLIWSSPKPFFRIVYSEPEEDAPQIDYAVQLIAEAAHQRFWVTRLTGAPDMCLFNIQSRDSSGMQTSND